MALTKLRFEPYETIRGRRRRWSRRLVLLAVLLVVIAVPGYLAAGVWAPFGCGDGLKKVDEECTGVTDGSHIFDPVLEPVQRKIKAENDSIGDKPYVTVALLLQFTAPKVGNVSIERIRSQAEGAYVAQHNANAAGANPRIRLVLANKGAGSRPGNRWRSSLPGWPTDRTTLSR